MKVDCGYVVKKVCVGLVLLCLLAPNAFAILVTTIRYDEFSPSGEGITDGLRFIWRFEWDGNKGDLLQSPIGPLPDSQTFWQSSVLFSVPESGDEPTLTFFSKSHKRPETIGHLGDGDSNQLLKFLVFETALFTHTLGEGNYHIAQSSIDHPSDSLGQHKDFVFIDFIKSDGQLFFEMRGEHALVSESSAVTLFLLGFLGLFSRRWI